MLSEYNNTTRLKKDSSYETTIKRNKAFISKRLNYFILELYSYFILELAFVVIYSIVYSLSKLNQRICLIFAPSNQFSSPFDLIFADES